MGLHETVKQVLRTHEAMIASADRADQTAARMEEAAARMEQSEQRHAALVDQHHRAETRTRRGRILDVAVGSLLALAAMVLLERLFG